MNVSGDAAAACFLRCLREANCRSRICALQWRPDAAGTTSGGPVSGNTGKANSMVFPFSLPSQSVLHVKIEQRDAHRDEQLHQRLGECCSRLVSNSSMAPSLPDAGCAFGSDCLRLERLPGGDFTHWKSAAFSRRTPKTDVRNRNTLIARALGSVVMLGIYTFAPISDRTMLVGFPLGHFPRRCLRFR